MYIIWKDTNMRLHGKRHKRDRYYFRWHYGKQRMVYITKEYVDKPTKKQQSAREAFTELRREVARQLHDAELRAKWEAHFKADNEGYKMLHTYVYAKLKAGVTVLVETPFMRVSSPIPSRLSRLSSPRRPILSHPVEKSKSPQETQHVACSPKKGISTSQTPIIMIHNGVAVPIFLPAEVPKRECLQVS